jgi:hypothetical protein
MSTTFRAAVTGAEGATAVHDPHDEATAWWRCLWDDDRSPRLLLGLAAALPLITDALVEAFHGWIPTGDNATILLRSRDVFSAHTPLVGQYSKAGWYLNKTAYSPGPTLFWLLAIPAQAIRWFPSAPLLWTTAVESVVIVASVWLADRLGGRVLGVLTALGFLSLGLSLGPRVLSNLWNADSPIAPLVLFVFLTWAILDGRYRLLPWLALIACFEVQADPSFGYVTITVGAVAVIAAAVAWWGLRREGRAARRAQGLGWPTLAGTAVVVAACWLPPVVQQLTNSPGNLTILWRAGRAVPQHGGPGFGLTILGRAVAGWWGLRWVDIRFVPDGRASVVPALIGGAALLGLVTFLAVALRRRQHRAAGGLGATLAMAIGLFAAATLAPTDPIGRGSTWLLAWSPAVGMVVWVVGLWSLWQLAPSSVATRSSSVPDDRMFDMSRAGRAVAGVGAVIVVMFAVAVADFGRTPNPEAWAIPLVRRATSELERRPSRGPYAVEAYGFWDVPLIAGQSLTLQLDVRGFRVGTNGRDRSGGSLGPQRQLPSDGTVAAILFWGDPGLGPPRAPVDRLVVLPVDLVENGRQVVAGIGVAAPGSPGARPFF